MKIIIALFIIVIDFCFVGFLYRVLKIWPALSKLDLSETILEDNLYQMHHTGTIETNIKGHIINPKKNRNAVISIILTHQCLVIRNTLLTYQFIVNTDSFVSYVIKKKIIGTSIKIFIMIDGEEYFFRFRTKRPNDWINAFKEINLNPLE